MDCGAGSQDHVIDDLRLAVCALGLAALGASPVGADGVLRLRRVHPVGGPAADHGWSKRNEPQHGKPQSGFA